VTNYYPRETTEFVPVTVTVDGVSVTSGVQFSITNGQTRPTVWMESVTLDDQIGFMLTAPLTVGAYRVWAKVTDSPEIPVIECGSYRVT